MKIGRLAAVIIVLTVRTVCVSAEATDESILFMEITPVISAALEECSLDRPPRGENRGYRKEKKKRTGKGTKEGTKDAGS